MKHLLTLLALVATAASAQVRLGTDHDGQSWYVYPETIKSTPEDTLGEFEIRRKSNKPIQVVFGVEASTCKRGFGELYLFDEDSQEWVIGSTVNITALKTTADNIAFILCITRKKPGKWT